MEAGFVVAILVALLASVLFFVLGIVIGRRAKKKGEVSGILNVDCSDPSNGPYLYLELTTSIADVVDKKQVSFNVHLIN